MTRRRPMEVPLPAGPDARRRLTPTLPVVLMGVGLALSAAGAVVGLAASRAQRPPPLGLKLAVHTGEGVVSFTCTRDE